MKCDSCLYRVDCLVTQDPSQCSIHEFAVGSVLVEQVGGKFIDIYLEGQNEVYVDLTLETMKALSTIVGKPLHTIHRDHYLALDGFRFIFRHLA